MNRLFILLCLGCITSNCFAQNYEREIAKAAGAYDKNQFDSCAYYFKNAFALKQGVRRKLI